MRYCSSCDCALTYGGSEALGQHRRVAMLSGKFL